MISERDLRARAAEWALAAQASNRRRGSEFAEPPQTQLPWLDDESCRRDVS